MLFAFILLILGNLFLSGMLTGVIITNREVDKSSPWYLYFISVLCFTFGLYHIVALIGYCTSI